MLRRCNLLTLGLLSCAASAVAQVPRDLFWVVTNIATLGVANNFGPFGLGAQSTAEGSVKQVYAPVALRLYRMDCATNPMQTVTPGEATVFMMRVNDADTTLTCSIDGASTTGTCTVSPPAPVVVNVTSASAFNHLAIKASNQGTLEFSSAGTCFVLTQYIAAPGGP